MADGSPQRSLGGCSKTTPSELRNEMVRAVPSVDSRVGPRPRTELVSDRPGVTEGRVCGHLLAGTWMLRSNPKSSMGELRSAMG